MKQNYRTIIPRNTTLPTARFLSVDEEAKYRETVNKKYSSEEAKKTLNINREGSNLFKVIELQNQGVNVASLSDLGLIAEQHGDWISEFYIDAPVIVLKNMGGDSYRLNNFLAKDLANQIDEIRKQDFKNPVIVTGLSLKESADSIYGLRFKITDRIEFYGAPELNDRNNRRKFSKTNEDGIPIFDRGGNRSLYIYQGSCISTLGIERDGSLDSYRLTDSHSMGKIIVIDSRGYKDL